MKEKYSGDRIHLWGAPHLQLCYMDTDTDSLVYKIKTKDFYANISNDVEERFDMSGYVPDRPDAEGMGASHPLPIGKNKKVI